MSEIMIREAENCDLKDLVAKFIPESIGREIEKACQARIFYAMNCFSLQFFWFVLWNEHYTAPAGRLFMASPILSSVPHVV